MNGATPREMDVSALTAHLRAHGSHYLSGVRHGPAQVELLSAETRVLSSLLRFSVTRGRHRRVVLVKAARRDAALETVAAHTVPVDRPRITSFAEPEQRFVLEYQALRRIHDHFRDVSDPRFGAIRVFELLPEHRALVMELVDQPTLRELTIRDRTRHPPIELPALREAFERAGAWLRAFHAMATPPVPTLHARSTDFIDFTDKLTSYIAARGTDRSFLLGLNRDMAERARTELQEELPLGVMHGDYAMRNILVGAHQKVTVLDTLARYRTSIYRDLGSFLANLYYSILPAFARGRIRHLIRIHEYREEFLRGYFDATPVPDGAIRLYETQALLENWSSFVHRQSLLQSRKNATVSHITQRFASAFFRAAITATLARSRVPPRSNLGSRGERSDAPGGVTLARR